MATKNKVQNNDKEGSNQARLIKLAEVAKKFNRQDIESLYFERISTGFPGLDQILGGGIAPGFMVLGAVSNLGKSTFVLQLAQNVAKSGIPVLFYSMEMPATRIASKAISRQIFIDNGTYKDGSSITADELLTQKHMGEINDKRWQEIEDAISKIQKSLDNLYVIEGGEGMSTAKDIVNHVEEFIKVSRQNGKTVKPLVIVDYLQILGSDNNGGIRADLDDNIKILKRLSNGNVSDNCEDVVGIPVIAISSINRTYYNKPLSMEGFKESGSIEYSSDVVLGLQFAKVMEADSGATNKNTDKPTFDMNKEKAKFDRDVVIIPLKQRYGVCGEPAAFKYYAKYDCFLDLQGEEYRNSKKEQTEAIEAKDAQKITKGNLDNSNAGLKKMRTVAREEKKQKNIFY